jgi:uncharacterized SAM-binding protein YcdF (DUF218 family)
LIVIFEREAIFKYMGKYLDNDDNPEIADVIVIMRGDNNHRRTMEAVRLYNSGYSNCVYISRALNDKSNEWIRKYGVTMPSEQDRIKSILTQFGISDNNIILENREPGGGTLGEIGRVRRMMNNHNFKKAIIVTNWWHTRRTSAICNYILDETEMQLYVVSATDDISNPSNWWKYRYEAQKVLEEYFKLLIFYSSTFYELKFSDDPLNTVNLGAS